MRSVSDNGADAPISALTSSSYSSMNDPFELMNFDSFSASREHRLASKIPSSERRPTSTRQLPNTERKAIEHLANKERTHANSHRTTAAEKRTPTGNLPQREQTEVLAVKLVPTQPPSHGKRKAWKFETEIVQLRAEGYTLEAIRTALANAGVHVSISTVRREANRAAAPRTVTPVPKATTTSMPTPSHPTAPTTGFIPAAPLATPILQERRSGKDVAEDFMRNQITNPLIRSKEQR